MLFNFLINFDRNEWMKRSKMELKRRGEGNLLEKTKRTRLGEKKFGVFLCAI